MILGYNQLRPTERNYHNFLEKLVKNLNGLDCDGLSLMLYGSFVRGDYVPGRSDIDSVIIFPHDVVIDKKLLHEISLSIYESLKTDYIPFQVSPLDVTIMRDGRFNSFTDDYLDYFKSERRVVVGPDYIDEMVCLPSKTRVESPLSHNLRRARIGVLFSSYNQQRDYEEFLDNFNETLNAASRSSKQILSLIEGKVRRNRFSALEAINRLFPSVDTEPLERIRYLYTNPDELDVLYRKPDELIIVWNSALTFFEELIREYIREFPNKEGI